ncbi:bssS family protein [Tatumella sp. TA1]|nr:bssS family protein [Tatumella sp. TA1]
MSNKDDIPVFPVAGWKVGPLPGYDSVVLKFQYLVSPMQPLEQAQETQFFAVTTEMAEQLISELQKHVHTLKSSGVQSPQEPKH